MSPYVPRFVIRIVRHPLLFSAARRPRVHSRWLVLHGQIQDHLEPPHIVWCRPTYFPTRQLGVHPIERHADWVWKSSSVSDGVEYVPRMHACNGSLIMFGIVALQAHLPDTPRRSVEEWNRR